MSKQYHRKRFSNSNLKECTGFKNNSFLKKKYERICDLINRIYTSDQESLICEGYIEAGGRSCWLWINFSKQYFQNIYNFLIKEKAIKIKFTRKEFIKSISKRRNILEISNQIGESRSVVKLIIKISFDPESPECTHFKYNRLTEV